MINTMWKLLLTVLYVLLVAIAVGLTVTVTVLIVTRLIRNKKIVASLDAKIAKVAALIPDEAVIEDSELGD